MIMDRSNPRPIASSRELLQQLRYLGDVVAPATILSIVLEQVGLVDCYTELETAIGPVFVVYNDYGVSAVMRAPSEADYERQFRVRFGRPLRRVAELPTRINHMVHQQSSGARSSSPHLDLLRLSEF